MERDEQEDTTWRLLDPEDVAERQRMLAAVRRARRVSGALKRKAQQDKERGT